MTTDELRRAFDVYFREMQHCEDAKCYWSLLHLLLVMPDICGSLEDPTELSGDRYVRWCRENMPTSKTVEPGDRYQMRNAVLHEGTTLSDNSKTSIKAKQTKYRCFSFVDPVNFAEPIHQTVNDSGDILNIDVAGLATDTRHGMQTWFEALQHDLVRMAEVERNLPKLARVKPKVADIPKPQPSGIILTIEQKGFTTSSS
jgi:hypothetical protein